jgi:hypothetical protein
MTAKWRCTYDEGMNANDAQVWRYDGHVAVENGAALAICHHETSHSALRFALGFHCGPTVVQTRFRREPGSYILRALTSGASYGSGTGRLPDIVEIPKFDESEIIRSVDDEDVPLMCWQDFLPFAIITCAGDAGERKFRILHDLPVSARSEGDRVHCENYAHDVWNVCGRDGAAFLRLAWAATQKFLEIPEIWRAVSSVADELRAGLVINSRPVPWPGVVQYAMPGHVAEWLMQQAGVEFGVLREEQRRIDAACLRRRPISKRWRERAAGAIVDSQNALLEAAQ